MQFCGGFAQFQEFARTKERPESHAETRESVGAAFLSIDDADRIADNEALTSESRHRLGQSTARRDDVLEQADEITLLEGTLDPFGRAVFLGLTADDDEGQIGRHRCRSCQRDGSQRRSGESNSLGLVLAYSVRQTLAERSQDGRLRLEPVLVEIPRRTTTRAQHEVAFEERSLDEERTELLVRHGRRVARAIEASRSNPGDPGSRTIDEPSA